MGGFDKIDVVFIFGTYKYIFMSDTNWFKGVTNTGICFN